METPLSERRITRSHVLASSNNTPMSRKIEGMDDKGVQKTGKHQDRSALIDITNDSPIVGLAMGNLGTPSSGFSKKRNVMITMNWDTSDSGEALLRGQVKTLLQKVEEEAQLSKFSLDNNGGPFATSPMPLLAPTPIINTPLLSLNHQSRSVSITSSPVLQQVSITKMVTEIIDRQKKEEDSSITRSLIFDFSDKSSDFISGLTFQGESKVKPNMDDDDDSSIWSIQANASTKAKEEDDDDVEDEEVDYDYDYDFDLEDFDNDDEALYDLCEDLSKIDVNGTTDFSGKHTRFCYNSDNETIENEDSSTGVLMLKGLPST